MTEAQTLDAIDAAIRDQGASPPALVYVGSPYAGRGETPGERKRDQERNVRFAIDAARALAARGWTPILPHLMLPRYLDDRDWEQRGRGTRAGLKIMSICDAAVFLVPRWRDGPSDGMRTEIEEWKARSRSPLVFWVG